MDEYLQPEDSQLLDRLVDGELSEAERRELLLRLERTPDGWRRCALAFLEGQAWRGEAKAFATGPVDPIDSVAPARDLRRGWFRSPAWIPIVTAAGLLVAVGMWFASRGPGDMPTAQIQAPVNSVAVGGGTSLPAQEPALPNMRLVVEGGPNQQQRVVEVPLVEADRLNEALFGPWSQAVPPEVLQMLERSGHQVVRERQLVPIDLRDGRRVVVPMDQVEITPVSRRGYQ